MTPEEIMRNNLFVIAQTYATAKNQAMTTVSKNIHGNQNFLAQYLAGEVAPTVKTYFTMVNRFRARWPRGTPWPKTAPIPKLGRKVDPGFADVVEKSR